MDFFSKCEQKDVLLNLLKSLLKQFTGFFQCSVEQLLRPKKTLAIEFFMTVQNFTKKKDSIAGTFL